MTYSTDPPTLSVAGELDVASSPVLRQAMLTVLGQDDVPDLVLETSGVTFVDSSGLGVLLMAARRWEEHERRLVVKSPSRQLVRVIDLLGVRRAFVIEE